MKSSRAHVILDAVQFAAEADINNFGQLIARNVSILDRALSLRILLTYLPESISPSQYLELLQDLANDRPPAIPSTEIPQPSKNLSEEEALARVPKLRLLPLAAHAVGIESADEIDSFILCRARRIDAELGSIPLAQQLVEPFVQRSQILKEWTIAVFLPLVRLNYDYYPQHDQTWSLESFERLHGRTGIEALLERAIENKNYGDGHYGRDLRGVVGPWMFGEVSRSCQKLESDDQKQSNMVDMFAHHPRVLASCWVPFNEWLLDIAKTDFSPALHFFDQWGGPRDVDYEGLIQDVFGENVLSVAEMNYAQTGLAMIYLCQGSSSTSRENVLTILTKVAKISGLLPPPDLNAFARDSSSSTLASNFLSAISTVHLLPTELSDPSNPLTKPSSDALEMVFAVLVSAQLLDSLGQAMSLDRVLSLTLFGSQADQRDTFRRLLHGFNTRNSANDNTWAEARHQLLWLRGWQPNGQPRPARHGVFAQISFDEFENEILKTLLTNGRYKLASQIYCDSKTAPLPSERVEKSILDVVLVSYDNASNGNRTRGGMKKSNDIVNSFSSYFPKSDGLRQAAALILATHRLSFYSLTLQHGVPFLPVNIRVHSDPLSLIDKVLKQNPGSYTKLDDLLDIGRDLVKAGLVKFEEQSASQSTSSREDGIDQVERNIIAKAIEASLAEDDFDTAYSYIVNRLSASSTQSSEPTGTPNEADGGQDVLWKAAYQAGRFRPKNRKGPSELRRLEQRMELLSQALLLAPPTSLQEVLTTWRECESQLNTALVKETEEEKAWNDKGERTVPGGFTHEDVAPRIQKPRETTRKALNEEAPMSLFDVTRNAAAALSKSAFPLRGQRQEMAVGRGEGAGEGPSSPTTSEGEGSGRVRKRDMVSNMVTGSLASGIGWVIGAPPIQRE